MNAHPRLPRGRPLGRFPALAIFASIRCLALAQEAREDAHIAVEELAYPSKRMAALQAFVLRAEGDSAKEMEWHDLAKFAAAHARLAVLELPATTTAGVRFVVSHDGRYRSSLETWPEESESRVFAPKPGEPIEPISLTSYYRFTSDGRAVGGPHEEMLSDGNIGDFNRDGQLEIVEYKGNNGFAGGNTHSSSGMKISLATIKRGPPDARPIFAVLYETREAGREEVEPWGGQLADPDGDGVYEFQIGPRIEDRISPRVKFHWDGARGTWVGPAPEKGAHFKVLDPAKTEVEIHSIVNSGGLGYPAEWKPEVADEVLQVGSVYEFAKHLPPDEVSKPYQYASLAALSDGQILDYMTLHRTVEDVARERMKGASHVKKLWELDPKSTALEYAHAHRPLSARSAFRYGMDDFGGQPPPERGTVTVSDGPSGCFAPSGAFVHTLHCAPGDSYLLFAGSLRDWAENSPLSQRTVFDFRKVPLTDAEARQALQIVWWLSRIRAQPLTEREGQGGGGSTSDGFATVEVNTPQDRLRVDAMRFAAHPGSFVGVSDTSEAYGQTAFLNLVVYFFNHDLAERLGARWSNFSLWERTEAKSGSDPYPPGERERMETLCTSWLREYAQGGLPLSIASVALDFVDEFGLKALRADVVQMAAHLPKPSEIEQRLDALDAEMAGWKKVHGKKETDRSDFYRRANPEGSIDSALVIPGLDAPSTPVPKKRKSDPRFAKFDALMAESEEVASKQTFADSEIASARKQIARTLRKLESWDDVKALERWAMEDEMGFGSAGARLAQLDRQRALGALRHYTAGPRAEFYQSWFANEPGAQPPSITNALVKKPVLAPADIRKLLKILSDAKSPINDRQLILRALVPPDAPGKYPSPEIDRILLGNDVIKNGGVNFLDDLSRTLALRVGAKAWDRLIEWSALRGPYERPYLPEVLPALAILGRRDPARFHEPLMRILSPQFAETNVWLDTLFWCAWTADLRMLRPDLERFATLSPADAESLRMTSTGGEKRTTHDRCHLARKIVSIWNEEDIATRAKLLVAFGTAHPAEVMGDGAEPMRGHLQAVANGLDASQRADALAFLEKCTTGQVSPWHGKIPAFPGDTADPVRAFRELVRTTMNQP